MSFPFPLQKCLKTDALGVQVPSSFPPLAADLVKSLLKRHPKECGTRRTWGCFRELEAMRLVKFRFTKAIGIEGGGEAEDELMACWTAC